MRLHVIPLLLALCAIANPTPPTVVFKAGETDKFPSIRIPALLCTNKGTLIAVAEGRNKAHDQAENDYILRRSTDNGKTWSKSEVILEQGAICLNNPCLVQESKSSRIFLFFQTYPPGTSQFGKVKTGPDGPNKIGYITSDDDGRSWSKPIDVSHLKSDKDTTTASGPGIGIQISKGANAGRLIMPFNSKQGGGFVNWVAYSDDAGKTWKRGADVPQGNMQLNEVQVCETSTGGLYLNSRKWKGANFRKVSWSTNGGESWTSATDDLGMPGPDCQNSILTIPGAKPRILALGPTGDPAPKGRTKGVIRISTDDGKTWSKSRVLVPGAFAYSSMALMKDGRIGVIYEPNSNTEILFVAVDLAWIEKGE
jgi:sialidase-1